MKQIDLEKKIIIFTFSAVLLIALIAILAIYKIKKNKNKIQNKIQIEEDESEAQISDGLKKSRKTMFTFYKNNKDISSIEWFDTEDVAFICVILGGEYTILNDKKSLDGVIAQGLNVKSFKNILENPRNFNIMHIDNHFISFTQKKKNNHIEIIVSDSIAKGESGKSGYTNQFVTKVNTWKNSKLIENNIAFTYDKNRAIQGHGYECFAFSIYNSNKEFFHKIGIDHKNVASKKLSYIEFNRKIHMVTCLLYEASMIYQEFCSVLNLWSNYDKKFEIHDLREKVLLKINDYCKDFLHNIEKHSERDKKNFNNELREFNKKVDLAFYEETKTILESKKEKLSNIKVSSVSSLYQYIENFLQIKSEKYKDIVISAISSGASLNK